MPVSILSDHLPAPFFRVAPRDDVSRALDLMAGHKLGAVLVSDHSDGLPAGILSEGDLVRCHTIFPGEAFSRIRVREVMTPEPVTMTADATVAAALDRMLGAGIRHLPVTDQGQTVGLVRFENLSRAHIADLTREIIHLQDYIKDLQEASHD